MLALNNLINPHKGEKILYDGTEISKSKSAIILIHGRGVNAESILGLVNELQLNDTIAIAPQASNFTWYPFRFIEKRELNEPGITSGLILIKEIIKSLVENGISEEKIYFLGFSQGACLILEYAARNPNKYGGVFALSGGLIGDKLSASDYNGDLKNTPIFLGCSDLDSHIPINRVYESENILKKLNGNVTTRIYKNLGHTINSDEIDFINGILSQKF